MTYFNIYFLITKQRFCLTMNEARKISFLIVFDSLMQNESSLLAFQIKFRPFNSFQTEIEGRYERRKVIAGDDLGRNCSPPQLLLNVIMDIRQEVKDYEDYRIAFCRLVALCRGSHYFCKTTYLLTHSLTYLLTYVCVGGYWKTLGMIHLYRI